MLDKLRVTARTCTAVAFYGSTIGEVDISLVFQRLLDWCNSIGSPPTHLASEVHGCQRESAEFCGAYEHLSTNGFDGVTSFELNSFPGDQASTLLDASLSIVVQLSNSWDAVAFVVADSNVIQWTRDSVLRLATILVETCHPAYGIAYKRRQELGPGMYALGIVQGIKPEESEDSYLMAKEISRWGYKGRKQRVWEQGILRDVYPISFLNSVHLNKPMESFTLRDWISRDATRGTLSVLTDDITVWEVPELSITKIREELISSGTVFR